MTGVLDTAPFARMVNRMTHETLNLALDYMALNPDAHIFPIKPLAKDPPLIDGNLKNASNDPREVTRWHKKYPGCNWGLSLAKSKRFVVDVDTKPGRVGQHTFEMLDILYGFPPTETVSTPSGGRHLHYKGQHDFALGKYGLGEDIDSPNYVLIPGCMLANGKSYKLLPSPDMAPAPDWFYQVIKENRGIAEQERVDQSAPLVDLDSPARIDWAIYYLENDALPSIQGQHGESQFNITAANLKDHGISEPMCVQLMAKHYNVPGKCVPLWNVHEGADADRIDKKVNNVYTYYRRKAIGADTAEAELFIDQVIEEGPPLTEKAVQEVADNLVLQRREEEVEKLYTFTEMCEDWVYIAGLDRFVLRENPTFQLKIEVFDRRYDYAKPEKALKLSKEMFQRRTKTIRRFDRPGFSPGEGEFMDQKRVYNLYKKPDLVPVEGDTRFWNDHLAFLLPNEEERSHLLNWCAWLLQNMCKKPKHALLIAGYAQGTGKSFIPNVLTAIIGRPNVHPVGAIELGAQFNRWAAATKLIVAEELRAVDRREISQKLHPLITEDVISINDKGIPTYTIENCFGIVAMTNDEAAISLDNTDRRYLVVRTHANPHPDSYYDELYAHLKRPESMAAVAYELLNRDLKGYNGQARAPLTEAKREMIHAGLSDLEAWLLDEMGNAPFTYDLVSVQDDIIPIIPPKLQKGANITRVVTAFLRHRLKGAPLEGQHVLKTKRRVRLWALHGKFGILENQSAAMRATLYEEKRTLEVENDSKERAISDFGEELNS